MVKIADWVEGQNTVAGSTATPSAFDISIRAFSYFALSDIMLASKIKATFHIYGSSLINKRATYCGPSSLSILFSQWPGSSKCKILHM